MDLTKLLNTQSATPAPTPAVATGVLPPDAPKEEAAPPKTKAKGKPQYVGGDVKVTKVEELHLYVDCFPLKGNEQPITFLDNVIAERCATIAKEQGISA